MFNIEEELKKLPDKPGVYIMHNAKDEIIYVGKAIVLKNRVRQYFQSSRNHTAKIRRMVSQVEYFEYIVTDSEREALVLECNLIKEHRPKYNTMLKDDKSYPYIKVTVDEDYPRVLFSRLMKRDKAKYFGPYTSANAVKDVIDLIHKIFLIRHCNKNLDKVKDSDRVCLYYHIGQCSGPCKGMISKEDYRANVNEVLSFLNGDYSRVISILTEKMNKASADLDFENAANYRDLIESVKKLEEKQKVNSVDGDDRDVIAFAREGKETVVAIFFVRDGKVLGREHFHMKNVEDEADSAVITAFVKQFYSGTPYLPKEIMCELPIEEEEEIRDWLSDKRGNKVTFRYPQRGEKHKLVELAKRNAEVVITADMDKIKREEARTIGALRELEELIGLKGLKRLEAYDISHISGTETVASMVVTENGKAKKSDYRRFRLTTVKGPDDYKSMEEVLTRRFKHGMEEKNRRDDGHLSGFSVFPDVLMMDGGKGQVNVALRVLDELGLDIPVCGMVKDDHHRTRGLYFNNEEIDFPNNSEAFNMITRMQDEAHRFAIEYHRSLRSKEQVHSVLDDIKGVGPKKRKALMQHFQDIDKIREAPVEELKKVPGITESLALEIYNFFS
ncbi:MAG: excinuclease ABC subunit UvrC [Lachnospiraceae bacterium]|nr:excinuclease ABC subunit UvrC [Lachnospiraceae bacterium]